MQELDKIILYGLRFYGFHGVYPDERKCGQWFELDVEIWGDFSLAANSDNLAETLDYGLVYGCIKEIVEGQPVNLLEHLARLIIRKILEFPQAEKTLVRIKKPDVSLGGPLSYAGIESIGYKHEN